MRIRGKDIADVKRRLGALGYCETQGAKHLVFMHPGTGDRVLLSKGGNVASKTYRLLQTKLGRLERGAI
jgi:hypothetical protein